MADFKQHMLRRLRSARQWLTRAEDAFDKDRDIRAELDLMLAQAELQHAKEAGRSRGQKLKLSLAGQLVAFVLAATISVAGLGGTYWLLHERHTSTPVPLAAQQEQTQMSESKNGNVYSAEMVQSSKAGIVTPTGRDVKKAEQSDVIHSVVHAANQTTPKVVENRTYDTGQSEQLEKEAIVTPDEMQKLVRAAGKSLRGH